MQWIDDDPLLRDLPAFIVALMVHAFALSIAPAMHWGGQAQPLESKPIAVEVVTALPTQPPPPPKPAVALAPVAPSPKPAPAGESRAKKLAHRGTVKTKPKRPVINRMTAAQLAAKKHRAQILAIQRIAARRVREENLRKAKERALIVAQQRAEEARERAAQAAAERAERERIAEERRAEQQRIAEERRAEAQRKREEAARKLAEARAEKARQQAELKAQLASLKDPDEQLRDAPNDEPAPGGETGVAGSPKGRGTEEAVMASGGKADLSAMESAPAPEPAYDMERDGFDPAGDDAGTGAGKGGLSWSIQGPVGDRRILKRSVPQSPAWVAERGLELAVQIKFEVLPTGQVKPGAVIKKTSGFPEIDRRALEAIRKWRFESVQGRAGAGDTWGTVTFRFMMG